MVVSEPALPDIPLQLLSHARSLGPAESLAESLQVPWSIFSCANGTQKLYGSL